MDESEAIEMDERERDTFLGTGGTGTIALSEAGEKPPHAVPVSYGYDETNAMFYFRLAADADSEKGDLSNRSVTFVTYGNLDEKWCSVVAKGRLRETIEDDIAIDSLEGFQRVEIPLVDIFGRPTSDISFEFYRLDPEELTTRKEST